MSVDGLTFSVTHTFPQPIGAVWTLLTDVERMAGLGPEHTVATWDTDARGLGATFHGTNQRGERTWTVPCVVIDHAEPTSFGWVVGDPAGPVATWVYALEATERGVTVVHTFTHGPAGSGLTAAIESNPAGESTIVAGRSAQMQENMSIALANAEKLLAATLLS